MSDAGDAAIVLPGFQAMSIDVAQCRRDLDAFDALLASRDCKITLQWTREASS